MSLDAIGKLVPEDDGTDDALREALARDAAKRLGTALAAWRRIEGRAPARASFAGIEPASGRFRTWLAEVEDLLAIAAAARGRDRSRLVDLVADAGLLARLAPKGRIPPDFRKRAERAVRANLGKLSKIPHGSSEMEIGGLLVERGLAIVDSGPDPAFARRVAKAMALLDAAFPAGAAMVRARTWRVVPVTAWATVSYSSARQPGIAYINVNSSPAIRLAEDLVHETTHIRVHEIEAVGPLVSAKAEDLRFYSPWRREWRPLRGMVHAVCTFTAGAMYFEAVLSSKLKLAPPRRRWLARRLLEERASVAMVMPALREAGRKGWLTPAGRRLVAAAEREHRALARAATRRRASLNRADLEALDRLVTRLESRPVRWSWD
ncbi:MAG TPA: HEXXH motif-containing putative peptide modification protein [Candidatus Polarisedimenticolaceae bacterium]|nr:HEXXH motif-containing putative peptide modification protein [Candidatus Polarisedimenticolaceae bacterium]